MYRYNAKSSRRLANRIASDKQAGLFALLLGAQRRTISMAARGRL